MLLDKSSGRTTSRPTCPDFEEKLMRLVGRSTGATVFIAPSTVLDDRLRSPTSTDKTRTLIPSVAEAAAAATAAGVKPKEKSSKWWWGWKLSKAAATSDDPEKQGPAPPSGHEARPMRVFTPFYCGLGAGLPLFFWQAASSPPSLAALRHVPHAQALASPSSPGAYTPSASSSTLSLTFDSVVKNSSVVLPDTGAYPPTPCRCLTRQADLGHGRPSHPPAAAHTELLLDTHASLMGVYSLRPAGVRGHTRDLLPERHSEQTCSRGVRVGGVGLGLGLGVRTGTGGLAAAPPPHLAALANSTTPTAAPASTSVAMPDRDCNHTNGTLMLEPDPTQRSSIEEVLRCAWMRRVKVGERAKHVHGSIGWGAGAALHRVGEELPGGELALVPARHVLPGTQHRLPWVCVPDPAAPEPHRDNTSQGLLIFAKKNPLDAPGVRADVGVPLDVLKKLHAEVLLPPFICFQVPLALLWSGQLVKSLRAAGLRIYASEAEALSLHAIADLVEVLDMVPTVKTNNVHRGADKHERGQDTSYSFHGDHRAHAQSFVPRACGYCASGGVFILSKCACEVMRG
ncbi:hypothetical protein B0H11DRAFT_2220150 [Mycena galericulata]|nr:hypothetical protein B0H11DRAFT_2220150 [Mycena galericulata]